MSLLSTNTTLNQLIKCHFEGEHKGILSIALHEVENHLKTHNVEDADAFLEQLSETTGLTELEITAALICLQNQAEQTVVQRARNVKPIYPMKQLID